MPSVKSFYENHPVYRHLGIELEEAGPDGSTLRLDLGKEVLNRHGVVHGGILALLVDCALGTALRASLRPHSRFVTLELKVNYLEPADTGPVRAYGRVLRAGKRTAMCTVEIKTGDGRLAAYATGSLMILYAGDPE